MEEFKKEKVEAHQIALGMFVIELDRPWIDSPFFLQGFLLDDQEDLDKMRALCQFVFIDRTKSSSEHFAAPKKRNVAAQRDPIVRIKTPSKTKTSTTQQKSSQKSLPTLDKVKKGETVSFMDIMREVKGYKAPTNTQGSSEGTLFNVKHGSDTVNQADSADAIIDDTLESIAQHGGVLESVGGFIGGLFGGSKKKKLKTSVKDVPIDEMGDDADGFSIRIYEEEPPVENEIAEVYPVYEQSQIATRDIFNAVAEEQELDLSAVSDILDNMVDSIGRTPDALLWLSKLKQTDDYAYNHALNVSITLMAFANFLALSQDQIKELGLTGLLQDVGKAKLSEDVLLKEGKLTKEEFEYAKKHVDETIKILKETPDTPETVLKCVNEHHERVDGSGYPGKLRNGQISLPSQAAGLIDTYCALTTKRCYAKGMYHQEALDLIHGLRDTQFSSEIVEQLIQFMGMYPVSSLVELNTGEVGVVVQQNQVRRLLPRVMLLLDNNKIKLEAPAVVNLLLSPKTPSGEPYKIVKSLAPDSYGLNPNDFYV